MDYLARGIASLGVAGALIYCLREIETLQSGLPLFAAACFAMVALGIIWE